ncbi:MAG: peptidoglycan DD-metalloendopeptidase family protein [Pirellulales bacterium]
MTCVKIWVLVIVLCMSEAALAQLFVTPLGGVPYQDWTIVNYMDLDSSSGVLDYNGGNYAYNGHDAIDMTLANFAKMDAGVAVLAAAAGTVTTVQDGFFDRCTSENPCPGGNVNLIRIDHGGGLVTEYYHLRKNSPMVLVGQAVTQGQQIAWVGSSGSSSDAHLHFTVKQNGTSIETYLNPSTYWIDPLPYSGDVPGALDFGVTDHPPTTPELRERPEEVKFFFADQSNTATMWLNLHGISNDSLRIRWFRPNGTVFDTNTSNISQIRYGWQTDSVSLPTNALGEWQVVATLNPLTSPQELGRVKFNMVIPGDLNLDGNVDQQDATAFVAGWLYQQATADINSWKKGDLTLDGKVDLFDAYQLHIAMMASGAGGFNFALLADVPEPSGVMLTIFAAMCVSAGFRRRARKTT